MAKFGPNARAGEMPFGNDDVSGTTCMKATATSRRDLANGRAMAASAALAFGLLACAGFVWSAKAQDADGFEAAAGFADEEDLTGVVAVPPERLVPQVSPADADPRSSDELFAAAMADMQGARFVQAQRLLELFVARDPLHPAAAEARRHLSELYQIDSQAPARAPTVTAAMPDVAAQPPAPPPRARRVASPRSVGGSLEESFMLEAGDRIFFAARSTELGSRARAVLAAQARWLKRNPNLSAVIEGHADDPLLARDGLERLAAERAEAVFSRLVEEGVEPARLAIAPEGSARPIAPCGNPECAAQNRRAVTVLTVQRVSELPAADGIGGPRQPRVD
jgi:outer membrane protein OmpA-like peptidoglycan-associated protein